MPHAEDQKHTVELVELTEASPAQLLEDGRELLLEYGRFVISHPDAEQFCFGTLEKEAARLPMSYREQDGGALVGLMNGRLVGFVAWRRTPGELGQSSWEVKRLWVRPEARGTGLGRKLTQAVLDRAKAAGRRAVYLDTVPSAMSAALKLYLQMGFTPCAPYGDNPIEALAYLRKDL
ncbi:GNAT family N-acetyltransferase [Acidobacteria bacterium AB60]|nr:GNAT family N-acetyltransferase [Acidobacteria bacterium AB60]